MCFLELLNECAVRLKRTAPLSDISLGSEPLLEMCPTGRGWPQPPVDQLVMGHSRTIVTHFDDRPGQAPVLKERACRGRQTPHALQRDRTVMGPSAIRILPQPQDAALLRSAEL